MEGVKNNFIEALDLKKNMVHKSSIITGDETQHIQFLFKERSSNFIMETKAQVIKVYVNGSSTPYVTIDFEVMGIHVYDSSLIVEAIVNNEACLKALKEALAEYAVSRRVNSDDVYRFELFYKGLTGNTIKEI